MSLPIDSEIWRAVDVFPNYQVSSHGRVRNNKGKILKGRPDGGGYLQVNLYNNETHKNMRINRLVGFAFIENPDDLPVIDHRDLDKKNNNVDNLRWVSYSKNNTHKKKQKNNTSGTTGVGVNKQMNSYYAQWQDDEVKKHRKYFSIKEHGKEEAERLAKAYRKKMMKKYEKYHEEIGADGQVK